MRIRVLCLIAAAVLSLTGCVNARETPAPISDAELQSYLEHRLDAAWLNTGLDGTAQRPGADLDDLLEQFRAGEGQGQLYECIDDGGLAATATSELNGGLILDAVDNRAPNDQEQMIWYTCLSRYVSYLSFGGSLLSVDETDYLYDYYREWIVPCVRLKGYTVGQLPTREQFSSSDGFLWIPYYYLVPIFESQDPYGFGLSRDQINELVGQCGDPFPGMPYGSRYGF